MFLFVRVRAFFVGFARHRFSSLSHHLELLVTDAGFQTIVVCTFVLVSLATLAHAAQAAHSSTQARKRTQTLVDQRVTWEYGLLCSIRTAMSVPYTSMRAASSFGRVKRNHRGGPNERVSCRTNACLPMLRKHNIEEARTTTCSS